MAHTQPPAAQAVAIVVPRLSVGSATRLTPEAQREVPTGVAVEVTVAATHVTFATTVRGRNRSEVTHSVQVCVPRVAGEHVIGASQTVGGVPFACRVEEAARADALYEDARRSTQGHNASLGAVREDHKEDRIAKVPRRRLRADGRVARGPHRDVGRAARRRRAGARVQRRGRAPAAPVGARGGGKGGRAAGAPARCPPSRSA